MSVAHPIQSYLIQSGTRAVMKTADEVDNGSTFINDADLRLTVDANSRYTAILNLIVTTDAAGTTSKLKYNMTLPSGSTELFAIVKADNWNSGTTSVKGQADFDLLIDTDNTATGFFMQYYSFKTGSTSGNAIVQWAQQVADASLTTLKEGSSLTLTKVGV